MKRLHELTLGAVVTLFALTACNNETMIPDARQVNEPDNPNECVLVGDDFRWEGNESRTALNIEDNVAKFSWTPGDLVGILPDAGAQVYFTIPQPEEGEEVTNKASFDGGAWALKATSNYAAYYPFVKDFDLDRTKVPVNYTGQTQTGNTTAHLGKYDYQGARPVTTNANGGGVTFDFDHVGALVLLKFIVPEAGTQLNSVTLSAEGAIFITKGTYDLTSTKENGFPITATETSATMTIELVDYTTTEANEEVIVSFLCAPVDLSGKLVNVSVAYGEGESASTFELRAEGKNLEAGGGYALNAVIGNIIDPAQTKKGDLAMKDGSFISYSEGITLTEEQKAYVAGIVFWTTADSNTSGTTPAKLTDDEIMKKDFPNCTHGLIVSLKDVSQGTKWQESYTKIAEWQNANSPYNGSDYKSIASTWNTDTPKDELINYILGYQNTKILKAYNEQCEESNKVLPVSLLDEFSDDNPAPANTTGWFIPSEKELTLLCGTDVDDIYSNDSGGTDTKVAMNIILISLGDNYADTFDDNYYWSSSESADPDYFAFEVYFRNGDVYFDTKHVTDFHVRAVCAY